MTVLVGGVSQLYQGDLDIGRRVVDRLAREQLGPDVLVEDLSYGAVAVAQRLEELRPDALVVVGAEPRGREPGTVERRVVSRLNVAAGDLQLAVGDAVTGYVTIDLLLEVASAFAALPRRTVLIEVEPARTEPSETLTSEAEAGLAEALALTRAEVAALSR